MSNDVIKELNALIAAGELAAQGEWMEALVSDQSENKTSAIFAKDSERLIVEKDYIDWKDTQTSCDFDFIAQAANARPALKQLLAEHTAQKEALEVAREALEHYYGGDDEGYNPWIKRMGNDCGDVACKSLETINNLGGDNE